MKIGQSIECTKSELDLFSVPPTQTSIEEGFYDDLPPQSGFESSQTVRFDISGDSAHYLNLAETEIHITGKIVKKANHEEGFADTAKLGVVNNFLSSLFKQATVSVNNVPTENTQTEYAHRAYFENLISFYKLEKKEGEVFSKDDPNKFNTFNVANNEEQNSGFIARRKKFLNGKTVQLQGKLHLDFLNLTHYMVNSLAFNIVLTKSEPKFYLLGEGQDYIFLFQTVSLRIRRQVISPSVMAAHALASEQASFKYPIKRVVVKNLVIPHTATKYTQAAIFRGIMPRRVICAFAETSALEGSFTENPYEFKNFGIKSIVLKVNSKSLPNTSGMTFDFANNLYLDGYRSLAKINKDLDISYDEYKNGYTFFAFDLNPDISTCEHYSLLKDGVIDIDVTTTAANAKNKYINMLCRI